MVIFTMSVQKVHSPTLHMMHTTGVFVARHVRLQRHGEGVLDFADDEDAVEGADAVKIA